jgi:hypothetical protein
MSMKNSNDNIGHRSRDLPICSAVSQPLRHRVPQCGLAETRKLADEMENLVTADGEIFHLLFRFKIPSKMT